LSNIFLNGHTLAPEARPATQEAAIDELTGYAGDAMPRYLRVARDLQAAIGGGEFAVGSLLPTELQLAVRYGVSRQTVRQAIGQLRDRGMLSARRRIGTRVDAAEPVRHFRYGFQSVADLLDLAANTEMLVDGRDWVTASGRLTAELGCRAGQRWLKLSCRRLPPGDPRPLCCADVYVDHRLAPAVMSQTVFRSALFMVLEKAAGEPIVEIRQEIQAIVLDTAAAARLDAHAGAPALRIVRRYLGTGHRLMEVSVTTLPADRFVYSLTIRRHPTGAA
jgi:GntR family transcriptional regulator